MCNSSSNTPVLQCSNTPRPCGTSVSFRYTLLPAPRSGGFSMDDYWVWCGSGIRGEDGRYHLFASRWPKRYPFYNGYAYHSEIVRAVADQPQGPYRFQEVLFGHRDVRYWDGGRTHNPTIHKIGDRYCLFYEAVTFPKGIPPDAEICSRPAHESGTYPAIGVATAPSPVGPWTRPDKPILTQRDGQWDREIVNNPAVCVLPSGRILLYYRSYDLKIGVAAADGLDQPFERLMDGPLVGIAPRTIEDMYVWWNGTYFEMIAKDCSAGGTLTGEAHAGMHATSQDGLHWTISQPAKAYSRTLRWDDGTTVTQGCLERAQLLIEDGEPRYLFAATADGPGGFGRATRTWNTAIPLERRDRTG